MTAGRCTSQILVAVACTLMLVGCGQREPVVSPAPVSTDVPGASNSSESPPTGTSPRAPAPTTAPVQAETAASAAVPANDARLDGFGPLRLGMTLAESEAAWPGLLSRTPGDLQRQGCFHAATGIGYFALMFDGGRFVRYGGQSDEITAPGGGRRGMAKAELQQAYKGALRAERSEFAGTLLLIEASGVAPSKLVFVLRPDGVVNEWYVGLKPQIDYQSACEDARS